MEEITRGRFILGVGMFSSATPSVTHALRAKHFYGEGNVMN